MLDKIILVLSNVYTIQLQRYKNSKILVCDKDSNILFKKFLSFLKILLILRRIKLNRATYAILLDVSPIVDSENNVLQHYISSNLVQLGLWGNVVEKNMRVKVLGSKHEQG